MITWFPKATEDGDSVAPGAMPEPVRATVCGEPLALSVTVRVAVCRPVAVGVKVTEMLQLSPAPSDAPQPLVVANSAAFVPVRLMVLMLSGAVPPLVRVTVWLALAVLMS